MSMSWETFNVFNLVSLLILYAALVPYCVVEELKRQGHGRLIICHLSSLILGYSATLGVNILFSIQKQVPQVGYFLSFFCFGHGYVVQFALLASCTWLNVMFFGIWRESSWLRSGRRPIYFERGRKCFDLIDTLYGWGLPLAIVTITCASNIFELLPFTDTFLFAKPGAITCFFNSKLSPSWIVYIGPLSVLMLVNLLLLCMTGHKLFFHVKETDTLMPQIISNETHFKNRESLCKERLLMYSEVLIVMCGYSLVMTVLPDPINLWYIYAVMYCLTALLVSIIYLCSPGALGPVKVWMCPSELAQSSDTPVSPSTSVMLSPFATNRQEARPL